MSAAEDSVRKASTDVSFQPVAEGETLVRVNNLRKYFPVTEGVFFQRTIANVKAVDDVSFDIRRGETFGLVGESGCGKTTTGRCILQLERATGGSIDYAGVDLNQLPNAKLAAVRQRIQVIFQDPYSSLNPRMKIGDIIGEPMKVHGLYPERVARESGSRNCSVFAVCRRASPIVTHTR